MQLNLGINSGKCYQLFYFQYVIDLPTIVDEPVFRAIEKSILQPEITFTGATCSVGAGAGQFADADR